MSVERPLKIIIFEASLELVPEELWEHPSVYKVAWRRGKRPGETLLDASLHHPAIRKAGLEEAEKRGRPDIVHVLLLEATSSPLIEEGYAEVYLHTIGDYVITVWPGTRVPRNYNRFVGLMEQLFAEGIVPPGSNNPLMTIRPMSLRSLIRSLRVKHALLYSWETGGEKARVRHVAEKVAELIGKGEPLALLLPGFPYGAPREETLRAASVLFEPVSRLEAWTLLSSTLALISDTLGLL